MKKSSEVCKLLGVTRKTLRGYDKIGLLHPTEKTDAGYWLYDDAAILKIKQILIYSEGGYSRKEIKEILDSPRSILDGGFDEIIERLERKKSRIESYITSLSLMNEFLKAPEPVLQVLDKYYFNTHPDNGNFMQQLEEGVSAVGQKIDNSNVDYMSKYLVVVMELIAIGLLKNKEINSEEVRACFVCLNKTVWNLFVGGLSQNTVDFILNNNDKYEFAQFMSNRCLSLIQELNVEAFLEEFCGAGSYEYLIKVINGLCVKKEMVTMKF